LGAHRASQRRWTVQKHTAKEKKLEQKKTNLGLFVSAFDPLAGGTFMWRTHSALHLTFRLPAIAVPTHSFFFAAPFLCAARNMIMHTLR
jgi:hypothetical protein